MKEKAVDRLVAVLSSRNRFQILLLLLLGFTYVPVSLNHVIMAFYRGTPPHLCTLARPHAAGNLSSYNNQTVVEEASGQCSSQLRLESGANISMACREGQWKYSPLYGENTIVSEWDLVCDSKRLASLATTIYFSGVMVGGLFFGFLSDYIGRRPILLLTLYLPVAVGVATSFAPSYLFFVIMRFLQGLLMQGLQTSSYALAMEFFMPAQRPMVGSVFECFWGATVMLLSGLAYALPEWRHLQLAISMPGVLTIFYICVVPESFRWLVVRGKLESAKTVVTKVASFNGITFPKELWEVVRSNAEEGTESAGKNYHFVHLFQTPRLRRCSIIFIYLWLAIATSYFGLTFHITSLPGNKYLNFFIAGAVEFVHYALSMFIMNKFGRKRPLLVCFLGAGVCCVVAASIPRKILSSGFRLEYLSAGFAIFGRFFMAGLFTMIFVYTSEIYPTVIRNIGMGTCLFWARLGGVIAPQINQLGAGSVTQVPILVFGSMMLLGGTLLCLMPETHGIKLPDHIDDVEKSKQERKESTSGPVPYLEQELMVCSNGDVDQGPEI